MKKLKNKASKAKFEVMQQADVPQSRNGKHRTIVNAILADMDLLKEGSAMKIPLDQLGDTKENVRSALSRESHKRKLVLSTAADANYLYVWRGQANGKAHV